MALMVVLLTPGWPLNMPALAEEEAAAQEWEEDVSLHVLEGIVNPAVWVPGKQAFWEQSNVVCCDIVQMS